MKLRVLGILVAAVACAMTAGTASADSIFTGNDPGVAAGGARPSSNAAAAAFDALVNETIINFESQALGGTNWNLGGGVTATLTGSQTTLSGIWVGDDTSLGYNTTSGGSKFLRVAPADFSPFAPVTLAFGFTTPITAWGAYITGLEPDVNGVVTVTYNDGSIHNFVLNAGGTGGGVQFFGIVLSSSTITSISLIESSDGVAFGTRDLWGIDDVRYAAAAPVPEPASLTLLGFGALGALARKRRAKPAA